MKVRDQIDKKLKIYALCNNYLVFEIKLTYTI